MVLNDWKGGKMGIKLNREEAIAAINGFYEHHGLPKVRNIINSDMAIADAATAHALQKATDVLIKHDFLARDETGLHSRFEILCTDWQQLLAEAGVEEEKE